MRALAVHGALETTGEERLRMRVPRDGVGGGRTEAGWGVDAAEARRTTERTRVAIPTPDEETVTVGETKGGGNGTRDAAAVASRATGEARDGRDCTNTEAFHVPTRRPRVHYFDKILRPSGLVGKSVRTVRRDESAKHFGEHHNLFRAD